MCIQIDHRWVVNSTYHMKYAHSFLCFVVLVTSSASNLADAHSSRLLHVRLPQYQLYDTEGCGWNSTKPKQNAPNRETCAYFVVLGSCLVTARRNFATPNSNVAWSIPIVSHYLVKIILIVISISVNNSITCLSLIVKSGIGINIYISYNECHCNTLLLSLKLWYFYIMCYTDLFVFVCIDNIIIW